jgi:negative regulator of flagellin synthesis FlgM
MKIGDITTQASLAQAPAGKTGAGAPAAKAEQAQSGGPSTTISLSNLSSTLHAMESSMAAESGFDAGRVEQIKNAIRNGEYSVDTSVVADKLIASVREMVAKPPVQ